MVRMQGTRIVVTRSRMVPDAVMPLRSQSQPWHGACLFHGQINGPPSRDRTADRLIDGAPPPLSAGRTPIQGSAPARFMTRSEKTGELLALALPATVPRDSGRSTSRHRGAGLWLILPAAEVTGAGEVSWRLRSYLPTSLAYEIAGCRSTRHGGPPRV